ncbi:MAG: SDR family oxidoreductase, partial [Solimonas sp.]
FGARAQPLIQDIAQVDALPAFVDCAHATFGRLDSLVNNAGVSVLSRGDILDVTPESFDRCVSVNLRAPFFLTQAFARRWLADRRPGTAADRRGSIVTVTSVAVDDIIGKVLAEYSLSKAGLSHAIKHYAARLAAHGIDCHEVRPGMLKTTMTDSSQAKYDALIEAGCVPAYRWGELREVAGAIALLASGALPYAVGQVISIDGGMRMKVF